MCSSDLLTNIIPIGEYITEYTNTIIEFFYWSPDACDIICKQAHTIKKWLETNPSIQYFYETKPKYPITPKNHELARVLNDRALRNVLYTNWNANWFQANKVKRDWFNESDSWFIHGAKGTKEHLVWLKGIKYIVDNTKPFIQNINAPDAFFHWEKYYCIGKLMDVKKDRKSTRLNSSH